MTRKKIGIRPVRRDISRFVSGIKGKRSASAPVVTPGELAYENQYQKIYRAEADFGSYKKRYFVNDNGVRTGLLAVNDGRALLVRQYRFFKGGYSLEIPGGNVEKGESPEKAALRECEEETGVVCRNPKLLVSYHVALDFNFNPTFIYYADEFVGSLTPKKNASAETNGMRWIHLDRCMAMLRRGDINDSFTMIGLFAYQSMGIRKHKRPR
jgi:ADP-ribose pyrophosphatase